MREINKNECPACRKKHRSDEEVKKLLNRLSRISGQINGIVQMLKESVYCPDILVQVSAAQAALASFSKELLEEHIRTCVREDIRSGKEGSAEELSALIAKLLK